MRSQLVDAMLARFIVVDELVQPSRLHFNTALEEINLFLCRHFTDASGASSAIAFRVLHSPGYVQSLKYALLFHHFLLES